MGDKEFKLGLQRSKSSSRCSSPSSSSTYVWPTQVHDLNTNDSSVLAPVDASSYNTNMTILCQDSHKPPLHEHDEDHPNLQYMIGLGHSSQPMDCNLQPSNLFGRSIEKSDESCSFKSMLQQDHRNSSTTNFQQVEQQWPPRSQKMMMYSSSSSSSPADSEVVFLPSLNPSQLLSSSHNLNPHNIDQNIHSTTSMQLPGLLGYEINHQPQQLQSMPFSNRSTINSLINSYPTSYRINSPSSLDHNQQLLQPNSWPIDHKPQNQLHLSNNAPFWINASTVVSPIINNDVRTNILSSLQMQSPLSTFDGIKAKLSSSSETSNKRPRNESSPSPVPAKARKEKMGDRITALQQLVSPFGKTDTASVLTEAIGYIKFLHEQVSILSNAYMKSTSGASIKQQQICEKWNEGEVGGNEDLRSRGLCVVPVSSTFPVTHETSVDFWNPTFGGTFR